VDEVFRERASGTIGPFRRRQAKTHSRMMREELGESFEHLRLAAGHAASGTKGAVGHRVGTAGKSVQPTLRKAGVVTVATVTPIALVARGSARTAEKAARRGKAKLTRKEPSVKRWPMLLGGLVAAGAAVGVVGAMLARRRANRDQWEEYGTTRSTTGRTDSMVDSVGSTVEAGKEKVQSLTEAAKERAADLTGTSPTTTGVTGASAGTPEFGSREDLYGTAGSGPNNRL
jgi:hypothetical protein